jgi:hypothetical protein
MASTLRFIRSASTPPKIDTMPCGAKAATAYNATASPDWVSSVTYHITTYWTIIEPNSDTVCPDRKRVRLRRQWAGTAVAWVSVMVSS